MGKIRILNICNILPLEGLVRENDIVLRIQDHLKTSYGYEFFIAKSLPFAPKILGFLSEKWKVYYRYQRRGRTKIQGYSSEIYPWIMPPTSNLYANYFLLPFNLFLFHFSLKKRLIKEAENAHVIVAQNNIPDAIMAYLLSKETKKPYLLNMRGIFDPIVLKLPFLSKVYKNASKIITHSPQNYKRLHRKIEVELVPHPVHDFFFTQKPIHLDTQIKIISVCRLLKLKNIDSVIKALSSLKSSAKKFEYHIVGDGPELENLIQLTKELDLTQQVIFHGYLSHDKVNRLLQEANIFVMPSYPETLGRSFLEAAASKCIIIGHENSGVDGLLEHKRSAFFANRDTIDSILKEVIEKFSYEFQLKYVENALEIVNQLTWENIGKKYKELYEKIAADV